MGNKIDSQAINRGTSPTILHYISDAGTVPRRLVIGCYGRSGAILGIGSALMQHRSGHFWYTKTIRNHVIGDRDCLPCDGQCWTYGGRGREEPRKSKWKTEPALAGGYLAIPGAIATVRGGATRDKRPDSTRHIFGSSRGRPHTMPRSSSRMLNWGR
jgi:hypothetical protein